MKNIIRLEPMPGRKYRTAHDQIVAFFRNEDFLICTLYGKNIINKKDMENLPGEQKEILMKHRKQNIRIEVNTGIDPVNVTKI